MERLPQSVAAFLARIDRWIEDARVMRTAEPPPELPGATVEVIKGRRDTRQLDSVSLSVIISTLCALGMKLLLIIINASLISEQMGRQPVNIVLMCIFCLSTLLFPLGLFATAIRSVGLMFMFFCLGIATVLLELVLEAVGLSVSQRSIESNESGLKQQFIFFVFLGQLLQALMVFAAFRMYRSIKESRQEETMIRVRRLGIASAAGTASHAETALVGDALRSSMHIDPMSEVPMSPPDGPPPPMTLPELSDSSDEDDDGELVSLTGVRQDANATAEIVPLAVLSRRA